jgi:hypothetical protein
MRSESTTTTPSSVDSPRPAAIVWEYTASPPEQFFSSHISSAERLPGENVLICEGTAGRIFEITRRGETVWEWISPFTTLRRGQPSPAIFRSHRYLPEHPALADKELDPHKHADINRMYGLAE